MRSSASPTRAATRRSSPCAGPLVTSDARHGDSISVNGVCLTVIDNVDGVFTADVMGETLRRSSLGALRVGSPVNLERAATRRQPARRPPGAGPRRRGRARSSAASPRPSGRSLRFSLPADLARYVVEKGSITVDGVSLTVMAVDDESFSVGLIPTTLEADRAGRQGRRRPGEPRGRRDREVRREDAGEAVMSEDIERAIADIAAGRPVIVVDDEDRENEGDLIFAAEQATPELVAFMVRYTSGYICVPLHRGRGRPARAAADVPHQPGPAGHGVRGDRRRPRGRQHRHLGRRPGPHDPAAGLGRHPADRPVPPRPRRAAAGQGGRRAAPARATPRPRSTWPCWPGCGRPGCSARWSTTTAPCSAAPDLEKFAAEHDLALITIADLIAYRRQPREAGRAGGRDPAADRARRLHRGRLPGAGRRRRARRAGLRRARRRRRTCWSGCTRSA